MLEDGEEMEFTHSFTHSLTHALHPVINNLNKIHTPNVDPDEPHVSDRGLSPTTVSTGHSFGGLKL
jgi:hypothetical protein